MPLQLNLRWLKHIIHPVLQLHVATVIHFIVVHATDKIVHAYTPH